MGDSTLSDHGQSFACVPGSEDACSAANGKWSEGRHFEYKCYPEGAPTASDMASACESKGGHFQFSELRCFGTEAERECQNSGRSWDPDKEECCQSGWNFVDEHLGSPFFESGRTTGCVPSSKEACEATEIGGQWAQGRFERLMCYPQGEQTGADMAADCEAKGGGFEWSELKCYDGSGRHVCHLRGGIWQEGYTNNTQGEPTYSGACVFCKREGWKFAPTDDNLYDAAWENMDSTLSDHGQSFACVPGSEDACSAANGKWSEGRHFEYKCYPEGAPTASDMASACESKGGHFQFSELRCFGTEAERECQNSGRSWDPDKEECCQSGWNFVDEHLGSPFFESGRTTGCVPSSKEACEATEISGQWAQGRFERLMCYPQGEQ